jgi:uroporphyrin-III C-methyltransferase / precorrin-2 dehydrogenase / sirohydrochlorin ferrochelatase
VNAVSRAPFETRAPRMMPLARLPLFFALEDRRAVIARSGAAIAWKAELLSAAGAVGNGVPPHCKLVAVPYLASGNLL